MARPLHWRRSRIIPHIRLRGIRQRRTRRICICD